MPQAPEFEVQFRWIDRVHKMIICCSFWGLRLGDNQMDPPAELRSGVAETSRKPRNQIHMVIYNAKKRESRGRDVARRYRTPPQQTGGQSVQRRSFLRETPSASVHLPNSGRSFNFLIRRARRASGEKRASSAPNCSSTGAGAYGKFLEFRTALCHCRAVKLD